MDGIYIEKEIEECLALFADVTVTYSQSHIQLTNSNNDGP